jgi:hypothetical protein
MWNFHSLSEKIGSNRILHYGVHGHRHSHFHRALTQQYSSPLLLLYSQCQLGSVLTIHCGIFTLTRRHMFSIFGWKRTRIRICHLHESPYKIWSVRMLCGGQPHIYYTSLSTKMLWYKQKMSLDLSAVGFFILACRAEREKRTHIALRWVHSWYKRELIRYVMLGALLWYYLIVWF